jgi:hypothetical protein
MIVAKGKSDVGEVLIVGLNPADIETMKKGLTKTKQGGPQYGFSSLVVFMAESDEKAMAMLDLSEARRDDDLFPTAGQW